MNEKDLVRHLSSLKNTSARPDWVRQNREVLSFQIFNGQESVAVELGFFSRMSLFTHRLLQPTPIAALITLFFLVSGVVGIRASEKTTPNDVLYIAKIISEKTEYATTFDEKSKAQLNVRFAKNRAAELSMIVGNSSETDITDPRVQELSESFKREIASVRERLTRLQAEETKQATINAQTQSRPKLNIATKKPADVQDPAGTTEETKVEEGEVFSAEASKDKQGIEISMPESSQKVLEEAERLFNEKNYNEAVSKLGEIIIK